MTGWGEQEGTLREFRGYRRFQENDRVLEFREYRQYGGNEVHMQEVKMYRGHRNEVSRSCKNFILVLVTALFGILALSFSWFVFQDTRDRIADMRRDRVSQAEHCKYMIIREGCNDPESVVPAMIEHCQYLKDCAEMDPDAVQSRGRALVSALSNTFPRPVLLWTIVLGYLLILLLIDIHTRLAPGFSTHSLSRKFTLLKTESD